MSQGIASRYSFSVRSRKPHATLAGEKANDLWQFHLAAVYGLRVLLPVVATGVAQAGGGGALHGGSVHLSAGVINGDLEVPLCADTQWSRT